MKSPEEILQEEFGHAYGTLHPLMHIAIIKRAMQKYADQNTAKPNEPYFGWCDVEGCNKEAASAGLAWGETGYWKSCTEHSADSRERKPQPKMKQAAINREKSRGKDGVLNQNY